MSIEIQKKEITLGKAIAVIIPSSILALIAIILSTYFINMIFGGVFGFIWFIGIVVITIFSGFLIAYWMDEKFNMSSGW